MDILLRILALLIGLALIVVFFRSLFTTTLLNRHLRDQFSNAVSQITWAVFRGIFLRTSEQERIDRRIVWYWPIVVFAIIFSWFALVVLGFAPIYWTTDATTDLFASVIASGSALSTLGFATPDNPHGQVVAIIEGCLGLFIVVYTITFLPGYLTAMQQRNDQVAWVYIRTGAPPTGVGLIEWFYRSGQPDALDAVWSTWEPWFRSLGESHSLSPFLNLTRPFRPGQEWLAGTAAMLNATALASSTLSLPSWASAQACFEAGTWALRSMAASLSPQADLNATTQSSASMSRATFDQACDLLKAANAPINDDRDQAWADFVKRRSQYEPALAILAKKMLVKLDSQHMPHRNLD